jgi:ATP synthase protein I
VAQPLFPEPHERPHLAELNDDPRPAGPHQRPHLAEVPVGPDLAEQPAQAGQRARAGQLAQAEQLGQAGQLARAGQTEPEERALLPEPPDQPVSGVRQVPTFRGRRPAIGQDADKNAGKNAGGQDSPLPSRGSGWTVLSYLIAGMMAYGAIGWLISRAVHQTVIFPVGMLFGLGISLGLVIYRYGRSSSSTQNQHARETAREEPAGDR